MYITFVSVPNGYIFSRFEVSFQASRFTAISSELQQKKSYFLKQRY